MEYRTKHVFTSTSRPATKNCARTEPAVWTRASRGGTQSEEGSHIGLLTRDSNTMLVQIRRLPRKLTILPNRTAARHPLYLQHQMSRRAPRSERSVPAREERWRGVQMTSRLTTMRKGELRHDARKRDSVVPRNGRSSGIRWCVAHLPNVVSARPCDADGPHRHRKRPGPNRPPSRAMDFDGS